MKFSLGLINAISPGVFINTAFIENDGAATQIARGLPSFVAPISNKANELPLQTRLDNGGTRPMQFALLSQALVTMMQPSLCRNRPKEPFVQKSISAHLVDADEDWIRASDPEPTVSDFSDNASIPNLGSFQKLSI